MVLICLLLQGLTDTWLGLFKAVRKEAEQAWPSGSTFLQLVLNHNAVNLAYIEDHLPQGEEPPDVESDDDNDDRLDGVAEDDVGDEYDASFASELNG